MVIKGNEWQSLVKDYNFWISKIFIELCDYSFVLTFSRKFLRFKKEM